MWLHLPLLVTSGQPRIGGRFGWTGGGTCPAKVPRRLEGGACRPGAEAGEEDTRGHEPPGRAGIVPKVLERRAALEETLMGAALESCPSSPAPVTQDSGCPLLPGSRGTAGGAFWGGSSLPTIVYGAGPIVYGDRESVTVIARQRDPRKGRSGSWPRQPGKALSSRTWKPTGRKP